MCKNICSSEPQKRVNSLAPSGRYGQHRADTPMTNRVEWAPRWSKEEIERGRSHDCSAKETNFGDIEAVAEYVPTPPDSKPQRGFWQALKSLRQRSGPDQANISFNLSSKYSSIFLRSFAARNPSKAHTSLSSNTRISLSLSLFTTSRQRLSTSPLSSTSLQHRIPTNPRFRFSRPMS